MNFREEVNVLSFDGGGTLGVMEMVILQDIMNTATLLKEDPKVIQRFLRSETVFHKRQEREAFSEVLSTVKEPIQAHGKPFLIPFKNQGETLQNLTFTEVFDMIVGTSTGSLISFALVGGNEKNGKRVPMTIQEIIQMYKEVTPIIFKQGSFGNFTNWFSKSLLGVPVVMYGSEGISSALQKVYKEATLSDFRETRCIAGINLCLSILHNEGECQIPIFSLSLL